ncbi:hypothetical protein GCM10028803_05120 [Larkinella knui]|uniref:Uncharacterized protein n=1 Tax=Larkinella knui TaxID=2025310 RepID=A0A3P1CKF8_9BACT|nr:hypothetical protein [Larkinella knui]RRB13811.1 hypothetical protein EHT87_16260 [Larkinella knui]
MKINFIPALNDELDRLEIDPAQLHQALEQYAESFRQFVELNYDQYEHPIEWLEVMDMQKTVNDFLALLPKIYPLSERISIDVDDE